MYLLPPGYLPTVLSTEKLPAVRRCARWRSVRLSLGETHGWRVSSPLRSSRVCQVVCLSPADALLSNGENYERLDATRDYPPVLPWCTDMCAKGCVSRRVPCCSGMWNTHQPVCALLIRNVPLRRLEPWFPAPANSLLIMMRVPDAGVYSRMG